MSNEPNETQQDQTDETRNNEINETSQEDTNEETPHDSTPEEVQADTSPRKSNTKTIVGIAIAIVVAVALVLVATMITQKDSSETVAVVNGEEISRDAFDQQFKQAENFAQMQGMDINDPTVRADFENQIIESMIQERLLKQHADEIGIEVNEEDVDTEIDQLITQFGGEEELNTLLSEQNTTMEELRENLRTATLFEQIVTDYAEEGELAVTDEEIENRYNEINAQQQEQEGGEELPPLSDVEGQIRESLQQEKQQQVAQRLIAELQAEGDVEVLL